MRRSIAFTLLAVAAGTLTVVAQTVNLRPGQYEYTLEMDLGIPAEGQKAVLDGAGFQKQKKLECLTAADVKDLKNLSAHPDLKELNCQMKSDPKWAGNKVTFMMTCAEDDLRMTMITDMTFGTDSFTTVTKVTDDKGRVTAMGGKMSARRVGECTK
jgi:Protein of unknown function (DUF3617)